MFWFEFSLLCYTFISCSFQCCIQKKSGNNILSWGLVYLPQYQQNCIDLYYFVYFLTLLFSCIRCSFEQNTRKLTVQLINLPGNKNFFFSSAFLETFFLKHITFKRYHFQSSVKHNSNFFLCYQSNNQLLCVAFS